MSKNFPTDFYVTCATVIPVLFLALVVQGGMYEATLQTARQAAQRLPRRNRDLLITMILPLFAQLTFSCALLGEMFALAALYLEQDANWARLFVILATFELLFAVTAMPIAKWWQVQRAVDRQQIMPIFKKHNAPKFGYGANFRPLWNERDREAEQIRVVLRDAGYREQGYRHAGFVVEAASGTSFIVACTIDNDMAASKMINSYIEALTAAGFQVRPDPTSNQILEVWMEGD